MWGDEIHLQHITGEFFHCSRKGKLGYRSKITVSAAWHIIHAIVRNGLLKVFWDSEYGPLVPSYFKYFSSYVVTVSIFTCSNKSIFLSHLDVVQSLLLGNEDYTNKMCIHTHKHRCI